MRRENPRTYRLSAEALEALAEMEEETGEKAAALVEKAILEYARKNRERSLYRRLEGIEARLERLEGGAE